jgi:hypothetical protein
MNLITNLIICVVSAIIKLVVQHLGNARNYMFPVWWSCTIFKEVSQNVKQVVLVFVFPFQAGSANRLGGFVGGNMLARRLAWSGKKRHL